MPANVSLDQEGECSQRQTQGQTIHKFSRMAHDWNSFGQHFRQTYRESYRECYGVILALQVLAVLDRKEEPRPPPDTDTVTQLGLVSVGEVHRALQMGLAKRGPLWPQQEAPFIYLRMMPQIEFTILCVQMWLPKTKNKTKQISCSLPVCEDRYSILAAETIAVPDVRGFQPMF